MTQNTTSNTLTGNIVQQALNDLSFTQEMLYIATTLMDSEQKDKLIRILFEQSQLFVAAKEKKPDEWFEVD